MRNTIYILLLSLSFLALFTTCKNPGIDHNTFSITEENIQPGLHNVMVSGKYDFLGQVLGMKLNIGLDEQLADAESHPMNLDDQSFSITVDSLSPGTLFHYCYVIEFNDSHKFLTEIGEFTTLSDKPLVRTLEVTAVDSITFQVKSIVDDDFGMAITERGICWNQTGNPSLGDDDHHVAHQENGMGEYVCQITGLELNTTYFVRAYAKNDMGTSYANEVLGFKTDDFEMPTVETLPISNLTQTSVLCGGKIVNEGSSPVTERGIRWGTTPNPDIDGESLSSDSNEDEFYVSLTGLTPNTTYYYCAFATNNEGTGYGDVIEFTTLTPNKFYISVSCSPNEGGQAEGEGEYVEGDACTVTAIPNNHYVFNNWTEGGNVVSTDRNYTFTVNGTRTLVANFTLESYTITAVANNNSWGTVTGGGTYPYNQSCTLTATPNEGYDFKNWTDNNGTVVSSDNPLSFVVTNNRELVANFKVIPQVPEGGIDGLYSVSSSQKVYFSRGNLQYHVLNQRWSFANSQYEHLEQNNTNISNPNYNDRIDLFGWGTGNNPTNYSTDNYEYSVFYDWGDNPISNGGNTPGRWRTLTKQEWKHVINDRPASTINGFADARYIKATVNNVKGVILFPDEYEHPGEIDIQTSLINQPNASFDYNISRNDWLKMEAKGCVFLPITGSRYDTNIYSSDSEGYYWSSTYSNDSHSYSLHFGNNNLNAEFGSGRSTGQSVRLVYPVE